MSGFINSKESVFDTIITSEGRRQLSLGRLDIKFATFTDVDSFYEADAVSGTTDASMRPHLETYSRPHDTITFESNDVGDIISAPAGNFQIRSGRILLPSGSSYVSHVTGTINDSVDIDGILSASLDSYKGLYVIGTRNTSVDDIDVRDMTVTTQFDIVDGMLDSSQGFDVIRIDDVEGIHQDKRLSHAVNFKYLPPINAPTINNPNGTPLGSYPRFDQGNDLSPSELLTELSGKQYFDVKLENTTNLDNLFCQMFDVRTNKVLKLDTIDYGEFIHDDVSYRVFFVGRIFNDNTGTDTFVNIFTLVFTS